MDLPSALTLLDGSPVTSAEQWPRRRAEIRTLFDEHVYGRTPTRSIDVSVKTLLTEENALDGLATRIDVRLTFADGPHVDVMMHLPRQRPAPVFLGLNFRGNDAVLSGQSEPDLVGNRWPLAAVLRRRYGVVTAGYEDIDPDVDDFTNGVHPLFYARGGRPAASDEWGALGAWAWGLSRIMDYLVTDERVDPDRVIVMGHSRLGKAAMWAAAQDERFAMAISNNSGCGGVSLSRRQVGETVEAITRRFPHWFCPKFASYADREDSLPVDQHQLVALIAPRPVYIASAAEDTWADPEGEFLGGLHASAAYELLGVEGLAAQEMPALDEPVTSRIGYHIRRGGHDVTAYDWERFADAADRYVR